MPKVWVVRAYGGHYTQHFVHHGYVGIDWNELPDLSGITSRAQLATLYHEHYEAEGRRAAVDLGQIACFRFDIRAGDRVITPDLDPQVLCFGEVQPNPYHYTEADDGGNCFHRLKVEWSARTVRRGGLTKRLQKNLRGMLTVFNVSEGADFLRRIGVDSVAANEGAHPAARSVPGQMRHGRVSHRRVKMHRVRNMDPFRFEELIGDLLQAMGLEEVQVTKKTGDGGVDVTGVIPFHGLAREDVFVQVKRQRASVHAKAVRELRATIKYGGRGIFVTTSDFDKRAIAAAREDGFPPIGLVDGWRLECLLNEYWEGVSLQFQREIS